MTTRRQFLGAAAAGLVRAQSASVPWYQRTYRWGQTNITERDPTRYDIPWWRAYWKRTATQGVIINAGGIVAYYPSKYPLQYRAQFLGGRDLYGELCRAAHEDGLVVLARMDSNRAAEEFFRAHPDWFARQASGDPYRAADKYVACINSPYYDEYLPAVITEIIERSRPEGVTDNSWAGLGRDSICYCDHCARKFTKPLPKRRDWDDPVYREWILWNYARRLEIWDLNNRVTRAAGGRDCIWSGMNSGSFTAQCRSFRDLREIGKRAAIIMLDHQRRDDQGTFAQNSEAGKLVHGLAGWDKLAPESMSMYLSARNPYRVSAKPAAEARMWMLAGFAGGIQPWWHHIGALLEDRRATHTAEPVMRWHQANERYLVNRRPVATVGVAFSQRNTDFYGRDDPDALVDAPYRGFVQALVRARIPYLPVCLDELGRDPLAVLVLPNIAAMTEAQSEAVRRFVERGGALIATGLSSAADEWGEPRPDYALAGLFGAHRTARALPDPRPWRHSYLRIEARHPALGGFEETDILPFGGALEPLRVDAGAAVPLTFIPPFPVFPPETAWMREPKTDIPGLVVRGRVAFLPADIDRRFARDNVPDHGDLLANLVRWAAAGELPLAVEGPGLIDCNLYRQEGRLVLHLVNLTSSGTWRAPIDELIPVGPLKVRVRLEAGVLGEAVRFLVSSAAPKATVRGGWCEFEVPAIRDHEVVVIGKA